MKQKTCPKCKGNGSTFKAKKGDYGSFKLKGVEFGLKSPVKGEICNRCYGKGVV